VLAASAAFSPVCLARYNSAAMIKVMGSTSLSCPPAQNLMEQQWGNPPSDRQARVGRPDRATSAGDPPRGTCRRSTAT
jgi:hypothetical protein